jgi:hypothetical protein
LWHVREEREKARNSGREPSDEGLAVAPSPLEECIFDTMTQIPPDPLHAELLGIGLLSISELTKSLTGKTLQELNRNLAILWASAPWKEKCPVLALSQRGKVKLNAEQVARVLQLLPFALSWPDNGRVGQWLNVKSFTKVAHADFQTRLGERFYPKILTAFISLAVSNTFVFCEERVNKPSWLNLLQNSIITARKQLREVFGPTMQRPNFHTTLAHGSAGADSFAIPKNFDVRTLETYHGLFRRFIANSSNHVVERQMMEYENIRRATTKLAFYSPQPLGHITERFEPNLLQELSSDPIFHQLASLTKKSDPHGGDPTITAPTIKWNTNKELKSESLSPDELNLMRKNRQRNEYKAFTTVTMPNRRTRLAVISKDDVWECTPPTSMTKVPLGPEAKVSLVQIQCIWKIQKEVWVAVKWYNRKSFGQIQTTTTCPIYYGPSSPRTSHSVIPVANLLRRVHLVQHGVCLLFNKFLLH